MVSCTHTHTCPSLTTSLLGCLTTPAHSCTAARRWRREDPSERPIDNHSKQGQDHHGQGGARPDSFREDPVATPFLVQVAADERRSARDTAPSWQATQQRISKSCRGRLLPRQGLSGGNSHAAGIGKAASNVTPSELTWSNVLGGRETGGRGWRLWRALVV